MSREIPAGPCKVQGNVDCYYNFPKKRGGDPLLRMPWGKWRPSEEGWLMFEDGVGPVGREGQQQEDDGYTMGGNYLTQLLASRFGAGEVDYRKNAELGMEQHQLRVKCFELAEKEGLTLWQLAEGGLGLTDLQPELRQALEGHHRVGLNLALSNWRLVFFSFGNLFDGQQLSKAETDDILQAGFQGLIHAAKRYYPFREAKGEMVGDPETGWAFSTYACDCIKGMMRRVRREELTIRLPEYTWSARRKIEGWQKECWRETGQQLDWRTLLILAVARKDKIREGGGEIMTEAELVEEYRRLDRGEAGSEGDRQELHRRVWDLGEMCQGVDNAKAGSNFSDPASIAFRDDAGEVITKNSTVGEVVSEVVGDGRQLGPEASLENKGLRRAIELAFNRYLLPREKEVLILRLGLRDGQELTQEEIGKQLGVTGNRVQQIEATALKILGRKLVRNDLEG